MLFDLRGRGRRRTVQSVYLFLAVLIGVGLVGFGVGGAGGGLFNSNNNNGGGGGGSGNNVLEKQFTRADKAVKAQPREAGAWANLARVRFQVANSGGNYDPTRRTYQPNGRKQLRAATGAWQRYLALDPKRVDLTLARQMTNAYSDLNDAKGAVGALEILAQRQPSSGIFLQLAEAAYAAGQERKGDLAAADALERTAKAGRQQVKARLQAAKSQAKQGASGGVPQTSTVPIAPKPKG